MVSQLNPNYQQESLKRQQKREIERQHKKAYKKLQKLTEYTNLPVVFDNHTVTSYGNFSLIESFKQAIGFIELLQKHLTVNRHHNF
jgi:glutaredoxin